MRLYITERELWLKDPVLRLNRYPNNWWTTKYNQGVIPTLVTEPTVRVEDNGNDNVLMDWLRNKCLIGGESRKYYKTVRIFVVWERYLRSRKSTKELSKTRGRISCWQFYLRTWLKHIKDISTPRVGRY